jgi:hypothetical protein
MATSIPKNRFVDQRTVLANEEARNRQISINLQKKFAPTRDALWAEHQATLYPDILHVRNVPTLQNLIADELESTNQEDSLQTEYLARQNLSTITDEKTTDYILDRLTFEDMNNLNQNLPIPAYGYQNSVRPSDQYQDWVGNGTQEDNRTRIAREGRERRRKRRRCIEW